MIYLGIYIAELQRNVTESMSTKREQIGKIDNFMRKQKQSVGSSHLRNLPSSGGISVAGEGNSNDHQ